jgi:hypothetical protein
MESSSLCSRSIPRDWCRVSTSHIRSLQLHACTEPLPEGNDRVRDIIDIWLLEALLDPTDLARVRSAAIETFRRRQSHQWPPVVTSSDSWARDYAGLITEYPDAPPTIDAAVNYLARLIERIDAARPEASDGE